jgi:predicted dehydrogenase
MNSTKFRLAFLGGGISSVVGPAHFAAINIDNNFDLVAGVFSSNYDINCQSAEYYRVEKSRTYLNIDQLITNEKGKIDACVVLTPTNLHYNHVKKLIENGIPVICEKALSTTVKEALDIRNVLQKNEGFLVVTYNYLGYPIVKEMRHLVQSGQLGTIMHIQVEMPQESYAVVDIEGQPKVTTKWRLCDIGTPMLSLDLAVHLHMLVKYIVEQTPINVVAVSNNHGHYYQVIDNISCLVNYTDNITCNMWFSKIALGRRNGMKISIYGDKASAEWIQEQPEYLYYADNLGNRSIIDRGSQFVAVSSRRCYNRFKTGHPAGYVEAFANYYNSVASSIRKFQARENNYLDDCFGIEDSIQGLNLLEAITRSSIESKWIDVNRI